MTDRDMTGAPQSGSAPDRLVFFDTTLRDGEQSPGCSMTTPEKIEMAHALDDLGVDILEGGFAISSEGDFEAIRAISKAVRRPVIASLARARSLDVERAARSLDLAAHARIHTFLASSDLHLEVKLKMSRAQALDQAAAAVRQARSYVDDVEFSAEDATRSDIDYLAQLVSATIEAGATTINLPDTVGYSTPDDYAQMFTEILRRVPAAANITLSAHCHDDLGMAVANSLASLGAGVRQIECTINGIGERAGNAALEEIAAALMVRRDKYPYEHGLRSERLYQTSQMLGERISFRPAPNKAVVGSNAFAHEAGIHQHGMLANPLTYEIMTPASVGVPSNSMVLGKHSGRHALAHRLKELGHPLDGGLLDNFYHRFVELADRKKAVYDQDLVAIATQVSAQSTTLAEA
jgi:2-isopropylmalate synthase